MAQLSGAKRGFILSSLAFLSLHLLRLILTSKVDLKQNGCGIVIGSKLKAGKTRSKLHLTMLTSSAKVKQEVSDSPGGGGSR